MAGSWNHLKALLVMHLVLCQATGRETDSRLDTRMLVGHDFLTKWQPQGGWTVLDHNLGAKCWFSELSKQKFHFLMWTILECPIIKPIPYLRSTVSYKPSWTLRGTRCSNLERGMPKNLWPEKEPKRAIFIMNNNKRSLAKDQVKSPQTHWKWKAYFNDLYCWML